MGLLAATFSAADLALPVSRERLKVSDASLRPASRLKTCKMRYSNSKPDRSRTSGCLLTISRSRKRFLSSATGPTLGSALPVERTESGKARALGPQLDLVDACRVLHFHRKTRQPCSASSGWAGPACTATLSLPIRTPARQCLSRMV